MSADTVTALPKPAAASRTSGLLNRLRNIEPVSLLWVVLAAVLLFRVAAPLAKLFVASFETQGTGAFTLSNYAAAYGRQRYLDALVNSLTLGPLSAAISVVRAVPMAWAVSRTDMPGKGLTWAVVLGAVVVPPYLAAIGWILLAGPNAGFVNQAWRWLTGAEGALVNVYSFTDLALVIALNSFPLMFILVKAALDLISSEMEDAANIVGAGPWTTMWKVTLPLAWPAVLAGFILVFLETIALFGTPAIIGIPARINVVTTQLWQFFEYPVRVEVAAAYAMPLLLVTVGLIAVEKRLLGRKGFVSQTGKGGERRMVRLGPFRWVLFGWCAAVGALAVVIPVLVLVQASFAKAWGRDLALDNLTLRNYTLLLFEHEMALTSVWNTIWFSAAAVTLASAIALLVAYLVNRRLMPFGEVLGFLFMAPFVIPGIVMAIGFYTAYASPPLALYGTAALLILAFTAPLLEKSLLGGWLIVFILASRELSAAVFLVGPRTRTMSMLLYDLSEAGNFEVLAAFGGILLAITLVLVAGRHEAGRARFHAAEGMTCPTSSCAG